MAYLLILSGLALLATGVYLLAKPKEKPVAMMHGPQQHNKVDAVQITVNEYKEKGNRFEDYVIQRVGRLNGVRFIGKTADYHKNGISGKENMEPDLKFTFRHQPFAVECKWRSRFVDGKVQWAGDYQVKNYNRYAQQSQAPVYVCIGVGGNAEAPDAVYFVPLKALKFGFGTVEYLQPFKIANDQQLSTRIEKNK